MPINLPVPPERSGDAIAAYVASRSGAINSLIAGGGSFLEGIPGEPETIVPPYPHVLVDLHDPEAPFNMEPYAWQHVYGMLDEPVSFEVSDGTEGEAASTSFVRGPRLTQTVAAISKVLGEYAGHSRTYVLKLLHLREIAFRAIVLEHEDPAESIAIPLEPVPPSLEGKSNLPLTELLEILRGVVKPRSMRTGIQLPTESTSRFPDIDHKPKIEEVSMAETRNNSIALKELLYLSTDLDGQPKLDPITISPAPDANGIIQSNTIYITTNLQGLGQPQKIPPSGPQGPGGGQYIEVLIDDQPASGRITTAIPHAITFTQAEEGTHTLYFFVSPGNGECIKDEECMVARVVHIRRKSDPARAIKGEIIMYNLPRAVHRQDEVILDFALKGVALNDPTDDGRWELRDHIVRVYINDPVTGTIHYKDTRYYNPHLIENLEPGTYYVKFEIRVNENTPLPPNEHPYAITSEREILVYPRLPEM